MAAKKNLSELRHYFVDEAGDPTLFGKKGRVLVGTETVSKYFIIGVLDIPDTDALGAKLNMLREDILKDPYFKNIPSMWPENKKTALMFHAKDDIPEVRYQVFHALQGFSLHFHAVIRNKQQVLNYVRSRNSNDSGYRYTDKDLYDNTVSRLFKNQQSNFESYNITFAKRWKQDRTDAFEASLVKAQTNFSKKWNKSLTPTLNVICSTPILTPGLQAVDYFIWALQRLYERGEERYIYFIQSSISSVIDVDDTRNNEYGEYYSKKKPLSLAAIEGSLPGI